MNCTFPNLFSFHFKGTQILSRISLLYLAGWFCFCVAPSLLVLQCRALKRKARRQNMDVTLHKLWVLINCDSSKQRFPLSKLFVPGVCSVSTLHCRSTIRKLDVPNTSGLPYIPSSTATSWQISDQVLKNSTKVNQPSRRKINLIWKNILNFLSSGIISLVQLTTDMWEFVACHSLGAGTATWDGSGHIHNADLPASSCQRGVLQGVPQQPKVILVSLRKSEISSYQTPHKNCLAQWHPHLSFHGTVLTQYKCVRNSSSEKNRVCF